MANEAIMGKIIFINHEKNYATIEYTVNGRKKTVNGNISEQEQEKLKKEKIIQKAHRFHVGDEVSFVLAQSSRGDRMIADCIEFKFNNAMNNLINKSAIENRLVGYLKKVETDYFVKETGSYIFFPLILSPWEKRPADADLNEPVFFKINPKGNSGKVTAELFRKTYIPEYNTAVRHYKNKTVINAIIAKVTPYSIFVNVVGEAVQAKLSVNKTGPNTQLTNLNPGDTIPVIITFISDSKIVVAPAS